MYVVKTMIVLLLALDLSAAEKAEFKPFSSTEGRFTIAFPGKPEQAATTLKGPLGDIEAHSFIAKRSKDAESYAVTYCDLPADLTKGSTPEKIFDIAQQGGLNGPHGKLVKESKTAKSAKTPPSRDLEVEIDGVTTYSRLVLVDKRLYVIMAYPDGGKGSADRAKAFLDSFKLTTAAAAKK